ncbi:MAG: GAF domain-containing protein, partial [Comamonas sp.]|nr:GAF domain-containing protein [Candidatus Comamonas equi]
MTHLTPVKTSTDWLSALQSSDSAWLVTDANLHTTHINDGFTRMLGYGLQDMLGQPPLQKLLQIPGMPLPPHIQEQLHAQGVFAGELQLYARDGSAIWVSATINAFNHQTGPNGTTFSQVLVLTDIGFTKRFEALQRKMLEDVVTEKPLETLLSDMCKALEQLVPHVHVSVMHVDEQGIMNPLAAPSIPPHIVDLMRCVRIGAEVGACGAAAFLGREVIAHDIAEDANWCSAAPVFVQAGLRACWSSPIKNRDERVVGTLAFYFDSARSPNALHRQLVLACLHLCAIAIER